MKFQKKYQLNNSLKCLEMYKSERISFNTTNYHLINFGFSTSCTNSMQYFSPTV